MIGAPELLLGIDWIKWKISLESTAAGKIKAATPLQWKTSKFQIEL